MITATKRPIWPNNCPCHDVIADFTTASTPPAGAVTIFDEGVRFPPVKLYARGVLNNELLKVLARNSRAPEAAIADARAALANDQDRLQRLEEGLAALQAAAVPTASAPAPATTAVSIPQPGPDASEVAAAAQMAPAERNSLIEGMVARLAKRMAENGSDVDGWLRLIRAYSVLGERDKALAAAVSARGALTGNSDNLRRIGELTKELGLEGS